MQTFYILLKDNTPLERVDVTDEFAHLLRFDQVREQLGLRPIPSNDVQVRNLANSANSQFFAMPLQEFKHFVVLNNHYQKMQKVIHHYKNKFSPRLIDAVVGNIDNLYRGLLNQHNPPTRITVANIPARVLNELKQYFFNPFKISSVKLSQGKYDNVRFIDGSAEFKLIFTIEGVALPIDSKSYGLQTLTFDILGNYVNGKFEFNYQRIRIDKERLLSFDEQLYQNRKEYATLLLSHSEDERGYNLTHALEEVAMQFVQNSIES